MKFKKIRVTALLLALHSQASFGMCVVQDKNNSDIQIYPRRPSAVTFTIDQDSLQAGKTSSLNKKSSPPSYFGGAANQLLSEPASA